MFIANSTPDTGIIPDRGLKKFIEAGIIKASSEIQAQQIQPASLDLRLGTFAYRLRASFLPGKTKKVQEALETSGLVMHKITLQEGAVLETGGVYLIPLCESLSLDQNTAGTANPKSSTGRLDIFTRVITDHGETFDRIPFGYKGALYAEVSPHTFSVLVCHGDRLCQLRLRRGEQKTLHSLTLSVDLSSHKIIGFRAKRHCSLVNFRHVGTHDPSEYWDILKIDQEKLILDPNEFYILASREDVEIKETEAAEMIPIAPEIGEFRAHYAGFFDPGFGLKTPDTTAFRQSEKKGAKAVLEVRGRDVPFVLQHGQPVAHLSYEALTEKPEHLYGNTDSHYQYQGLKLSKVFADFPKE